MSGEPAVRVEGLVKTYRRGRRPVEAVRRVDLVVAPGQVVGLLGPNGAGKTTTVKCLATLVRPTAGRVHVDGVDVVAHPRRAARHVTALLEGNRNVYWRLSVAENLQFFAGLQGLSARSQRGYHAELLERLSLADRAGVPARTLSKGMQQKLAVAAALARRTPVVLLDEPTLGLDVETTRDLRGHVRDLAALEGRTVLLSSHDLGVVEDVADRVVVIGGGRVLADAPTAELVRAARRAVYRVAVEGPLPEDLVRRLPGAAVEADGAVVCPVDEEADGPGPLLDAVRGAGARVVSVRREGADLEAAFLRLLADADGATSPTVAPT